MRKLVASIFVFLLASALPVRADETRAHPATTLDRLLEQVQSGSVAEQNLNAKREAEFLAARDEQRALLSKAKVTLAAEEDLSEALESAFEQNELRIGDLEKRLTARLGNLGELVGVVRLVAGETANDLENSIVSAQFPDRTSSLLTIADSRELPTTEQLRTLWFSLQKEMTENGKVARFQAPIILPNGTEEERSIVRIGAFNAIADGNYLAYLPGMGRLAELSRQPAARYQELAKDFEAASAGIMPVAIDPTRGALLSLLLQAPSLWERISQGGAIGYVIIVIAIVGFFIAGERAVYLFVIDRRVRQQLETEQALPGNPLGDVISVYESNRDADRETLELKLDEAVLQGIPSLERGLSTIRVLAAVAPLLGLLGTVTGMIETFQSITLFGTGDPKVMAGGISQALVTTALGLVTAIPLVLMHSFVRGRSGRLIHILDEQSAGIVAQRAEAGQ